MFRVIIPLNFQQIRISPNVRKGADMKIGEFAKKFDTSVSTVRHYINLGLLVPEKDGFQYCFEDDDCREMEIIITMKNAGFKLSELNKYLSIFRFYKKNCWNTCTARKLIFMPSGTGSTPTYASSTKRSKRSKPAAFTRQGKMQAVMTRALSASSRDSRCLPSICCAALTARAGFTCPASRSPAIR